MLRCAKLEAEGLEVPTVSRAHGQVLMGYTRTFAHDYFERWGHWSTGGHCARPHRWVGHSGGRGGRCSCLHAPSPILVLLEARGWSRQGILRCSWAPFGPSAHETSSAQGFSRRKGEAIA